MQRTWTGKEREKLRELAAEKSVPDWDRIAEQLGTGRKADAVASQWKKW